MSGFSSSPPFALSFFFFFFNETKGEAANPVLSADAVQSWQGLKKNIYSLFTQYCRARKTCQHSVLAHEVFLRRLDCMRKNPYHVH